MMIVFVVYVNYLELFHVNDDHSSLRLLELYYQIIEDHFVLIEKVLLLFVELV